MRFTPEFKKTRQVMRAPSPNHPIHRRNHTGPRDPRRDGLTDDLRILLANWFFKAVQKALQDKERERQREVETRKAGRKAVLHRGERACAQERFRSSSGKMPSGDEDDPPEDEPLLALRR